VSAAAEDDDVGAIHGDDENRTTVFLTGAAAADGIRLFGNLDGFG
jgi:hypothetical protein